MEDDNFKESYAPCMMCKGPNDMGEVCAVCAETNEPLGTDVETSGGWMVQDRQ